MLIALGFGRALERTGCLEAIIMAIVQARVKSFGACFKARPSGRAFATICAGVLISSIALRAVCMRPCTVDGIFRH